MAGVEVLDVPGEQCYVIKVDGARAGLLEYQVMGDVFVALHTEIYPEFEGKGLAAILVREVLDRVRDTGLRLRPLCPYVASYLKKHPEYADLVGEASNDARGVS